MRHKVNASKIIAFMTSFILLFTFPSCSGSKVSKTSFLLNTTCTITIYNMNVDAAGTLIDSSFKLISGYEDIFSRTKEGSDVSRINVAKGQPTHVSNETIDLIKLAIQFGDLSSGRFDVTVGELSDLWNFTSDTPHVPNSSDIKDAVKHVNYKNIVISGDTVQLRDEDEKIDLGGIAKGYIADKVSNYLTSQKVEAAVINLGGNIVTIGDKSNNKPFVIGIEQPFTDNSKIIGSVESSDSTIVTSGIYERKFIQDGVLYHHILDPKTGYPYKTDLISSTIIAKINNSAFADGMSTTCLMLGKDDALKLIEDCRKKYPDYDLQVLLIDKDNKVYKTDGLSIKLEGEYANKS